MTKLVESPGENIPVGSPDVEILRNSGRNMEKVSIFFRTGSMSHGGVRRILSVFGSFMDLQHKQLEPTEQEVKKPSRFVA